MWQFVHWIENRCYFPYILSPFLFTNWSISEMSVHKLRISSALSKTDTAELCNRKNWALWINFLHTDKFSVIQSDNLTCFNKAEYGLWRQQHAKLLFTKPEVMCFLTSTWTEGPCFKSSAANTVLRRVGSAKAWECWPTIWWECWKMLGNRKLNLVGQSKEWGVGQDLPLKCLTCLWPICSFCSVSTIRWAALPILPLHSGVLSS